MTVENINRITVIGSGQTGLGITQVFAMRGYTVKLLDISETALKQAIQKIEWSLNKFVEKNRIRKRDADTTLARITTTTDYADALQNTDFALETVPENRDLKGKVFAKIDELAPTPALIATNTSTVSITKLAKATKRPDKVVGMHWFTPPQLMQLIEVIRGNDTSNQTITTVMELCRNLKKTPILCKKDSSGFIVNRVLGAVVNEAFWAYHRGETSKEGIDASARYTGGFPMGWFELCDFVGLDSAYEVGKLLYETHGERFKLCLSVIEPLVNENRLGQKVGVGFYDWSKNKPRIPFELADEYDIERSWVVAINEAAWLIHEDVADPESIDTGMKLGTAWPSGPCEFSDRKGLDWVLNKLNGLRHEHNMEMYTPCPWLQVSFEQGRLGRKSGRGFYKY
jgi:enoyl-CoA hydratase/3-hydroxyacyl-CoA dehydrogenase